VAVEMDGLSLQQEPLQTEHLLLAGVVAQAVILVAQAKQAALVLSSYEYPILLRQSSLMV
jgi:hypothetical protein